MKKDRLSFAAAFALLSAGMTFAQTTAAPASPATTLPTRDETLELDVFTVTTSSDIGYQSTNAAEATRMNTPIENIPMNVTILNAQFIEDLLATDSSEVLAYDASSVRRTENDGFISRGSQTVSTNFLNGFEQAAGFGSQPLANIDRVEIMRGPAAVLYGAGGYGGVYNRITKRAAPRPFVKARTILSEGFGYRHELDYNAGALPRLGNKLLFRLNGVLGRNDTWFGQRNIEEAIAPTFTWNIGPRTSLTVEYIYNFRETQASWETPMKGGDPHGLTLGDGTYRAMPRKTNWTSPEDFRRNTRTSTATDFRHAFTNDLQFRSQFQYETREQDLEETVANGTTLIILKDTALTGRYWRRIPRVTRSYRTRNELIWNVKTGPVSHRLLAGIAWDETYDDQKTYQSAQPTLNGTFANVTYADFLANPASIGYNATAWLLPVNLYDREAEPDVPPVAQRNIAPLTAYTRNYLTTTQYYVNDLFSLVNDRLFFTAGVRQSSFDRRNQNRRTGTGNNATIATTFPTVADGADATTHSIGAVWHLTADKRFSLYANANNAFQPEYRINADGSKLDPSTGEQKEVGLRFNFLSGRVQGLFTYFDLLENSNIADPDNLGYFIRQNGQRSTGYELNLNTRITDNWSLMGGVAKIDARNDITGIAKDLQPKWSFSAFNNYKFTSGKLKGLNLSLGAIYKGERPLTASTSRGETNWGPAPEWWRVDAIIGYKLKPKKSRFTWDFSLKVTNVLDNQDIYYVLAYHRYTVEPGRTWQAVAGVRF